MQLKHWNHCSIGGHGIPSDEKKIEDDEIKKHVEEFDEKSKKRKEYNAEDDKESVGHYNTENDEDFTDNVGRTAHVESYFIPPEATEPNHQHEESRKGLSWKEFEAASPIDTKRGDKLPPDRNVKIILRKMLVNPITAPSKEENAD